MVLYESTYLRVYIKSLYGMSFSVKSLLHKILYPAEYDMGRLYNSLSTNIIQNLDIS